MAEGDAIRAAIVNHAREVSYTFAKHHLDAIKRRLLVCTDMDVLARECNKIKEDYVTLDDATKLLLADYCDVYFRKVGETMKGLSGFVNLAGSSSQKLAR